jgi:hypothetical protein
LQEQHRTPIALQQ